MSVKTSSIPIEIVASLAVGTIAIAGFAESASAATLTGTIDLKTGDYWGDLWQRSDLASFVRSPVNQYSDSYYETVFKLNLDPANSPFKAATFDIDYDADPWGMSTHIGDSISNNGYRGDASHQSNDAEMHIGVPQSSSPSPASDDMLVYGNDNFSGTSPLIQAFDLVKGGSTLSLTVSDNQLQWDDNSGNSGMLNSPYLYALDGQSDSQGPVNYDIFAAFNRSIGTIGRPGSGVSQVTITLQESPESVPEPSTLLGLLGVGAVGVSSLLKSKNQKV
ncbi:PEP-CTERM sorting domain-containing protein [Lyngbya sp. CCY1209]|uniref:PEP-CTERM sorting domain-containing protein n=1 Tax=Lyngbya sp. CCY1209 TaxID=2886103 RepID=UPI002D20F9F2|nr:PEP-CTERM sorting domain-containing protein [Lyngbya sp. CCY1209]MEB3882539.1 PEP-CTERM sorting domain-containing protein [Lyngbya sp. CCY1209]